MLNYYPVSLNLENKQCLVVGAGPVAARKVARLLDCGALVTVIAPVINAGLKALAKKKKITLKHNRVNLSDLNRAFLVISATGERKINTLISAYCRKKGILVNVVDAPSECNFILPSILRRGDLTIAISTNGVSPALSKKIRQELEQKFGVEYLKLLRILEEIRPEALKKIKSPESRKIFFEKAVQTKMLNLLKKNKEGRVRVKLRAILKNAAV
ncbi:MAG: bifunctional precorrin-2 dehydrogenase/sirohydrochlorin ferrochelatase [Candidatus Omnitrophota bacterium]|nr:bifunctional precorrin-2 dehydrogenase/sirohydrochlorin ferrochelatase [Candidatus Omnitrophota bacterium]